MSSGGRTGLWCGSEPDTKRASEGARFLVQGPQRSQISRFFELGDATRLKSPTSRPSLEGLKRSLLAATSLRGSRHECRSEFAFPRHELTSSLISLNAMLFNEFFKAHRKVGERGGIIAVQDRRLGELETIGTQMRLVFRGQAAQIRKAAPRIVVKDR
jgi:hypothetical protein